MSQRVTEFFAELDMNHSAIFTETVPTQQESAQILTGLVARATAMSLGHVASDDEVVSITGAVVDTLLKFRDDMTRAKKRQS
jgi:hypothetical protein